MVKVTTLQLQVNLRCTCRASLGQRMHCAALHCNASQPAHPTCAHPMLADMHNPCKTPASIMHQLRKHVAKHSLYYAVQITLTSGWSRTSSDCPAVVLRYTTLVSMPQLPLSQLQHLHHVIHYNAGAVLTYLLYNSCNVSIICSTLSCHYATMSCMLHAML